MWILASSHGTSSPSIQIFSDLVIGIGSNPFCDGVADLGGGALVLAGISNGLGDAGRGIRSAPAAEEVEHQRRRPDRRDRIGLARSDDVGGGTVHRLEQRWSGTGRVEVARRGQ